MNNKEFYLSHLDLNSQMLIPLIPIDIKDKKNTEQFIYHTQCAITPNYIPYELYYIIALIYRY